MTRINLGVKPSELCNKHLLAEQRELKRIPEEGEIFEVTVERFDILNGNNKHKTVFVTKLDDEITEETTIPNEEDIQNKEPENNESEEENKEQLSTEPTQNVEKPKANTKKNNTKKK